MKKQKGEIVIALMCLILGISAGLFMHSGIDNEKAQNERSMASE